MGKKGEKKEKKFKRNKNIKKKNKNKKKPTTIMEEASVPEGGRTAETVVREDARARMPDPRSTLPIFNKFK